MRYQDHPTWQMLEKSKKEFKAALDDAPRFHPVHDVLEQAHTSLVKLQLALEDRLCKEMSDD